MHIFAAFSYQFNVFAFELEADLRHGESVEVPSELRAGVLDGVLGDLFLLEEVRAVGVALVGFLIDVEALEKSQGMVTNTIFLLKDMIFSQRWCLSTGFPSVKILPTYLLRNHLTEICVN